MTDGRGVRLLTDLNNIFKRDPNIDEYDVLPVIEPKHNKSPLVVVDHKLGVELWCVSILYQHAYDRLFSWRDKNGGGKFIDPVEVGNLCRAVLLVNPECYTAWNIRKECVESCTLNIEDDLKLGRLILTKHPKSPETFIHRRWLLQRYINQCLIFLPTNQNSSSNNTLIPVQLNTNIQRLVTQEFAVCLHAAEHYPCNYHAWSHRIWLIQTAYNNSIQVLLTELQKTIIWFAQHVSDHSGFHYRQFLLTSLMNQSKTLLHKYHIDINDIITQEFDKTCDLIACFPGHEALWYHR
ncbi:hypothetical protein LOTGIDRAFT_102637 [Lottia gigantea]|uniref:Protein prenyltransferase alpha subunit repeat-containing protein 1 n=1 Tax=Lottia gigantea TaxID=225164 RepID=V4BH68_LOTGI|nr:hypothetical protein LOTGIDRAFT_102637 [Lottia gigantea]ESP05302.1 hypothetical protein LOTGIDRAFT_102637 [Lottia gigantea]